MSELKTYRAPALWISLASLLASTAIAQTQPFSMMPGAWSSNFQVSVNGKDSTVLLQKVKTELALSLPVGMKEQALATLNTAMTRGNATTCISAQTAAANSTPTALFTNLSKMNPRCTFQPTQLTSTTQYFSGRCDDPANFTGYITGKVYLVSPSAWRGSFTGQGRVPDIALQALELPSGTVVQMQSTSQSKWIAPTCPAPVSTAVAIK